MIIYPAIDLKDGKCVRLTKGDFNQETIYSRSPLEQAKVFEEKGFQYLQDMRTYGPGTLNINFHNFHIATGTPAW